MSSDRITLLEGLGRLQKFARGQLPLEELWALHGDGTSFQIINKGGPGQMVELLLGLSTSSRSIDFSDGELKSSGMKIKDDKIVPRETIAITNISSRIDLLLAGIPFRDSFLHHKVRNLLLAPVVQPEKSDRSGWYLGEPRHIEVLPGTGVFKVLEEDFRSICSKMTSDVRSGDNIHTTSGHYLQIRSKDSKPYHPIYSDKLARNVSAKNYAFYFRKPFIEDALAGRI